MTTRRLQLGSPLPARSSNWVLCSVAAVDATPLSTARRRIDADGLPAAPARKVAALRGGPLEATRGTSTVLPRRAQRPLPRTARRPGRRSGPSSAVPEHASRRGAAPDQALRSHSACVSLRARRLSSRDSRRRQRVLGPGLLLGLLGRFSSGCGHRRRCGARALKHWSAARRRSAAGRRGVGDDASRRRGSRHRSGPEMSSSPPPKATSASACAETPSPTGNSIFRRCGARRRGPGGHCPALPIASASSSSGHDDVHLLRIIHEVDLARGPARAPSRRTAPAPGSTG